MYWNYWDDVKIKVTGFSWSDYATNAVLSIVTELRDILPEQSVTNIDINLKLNQFFLRLQTQCNFSSFTLLSKGPDLYEALNLILHDCLAARRGSTDRRLQYAKIS